MANISQGIHILTQADLDRLTNEAYQRGVQRGLLEQQLTNAKERVALNCANWKDGTCQTCGVSWQQHEVSSTYKCPYFQSRKSQS